MATEDDEPVGMDDASAAAPAQPLAMKSKNTKVVAMTTPADPASGTKTTGGTKVFKAATRSIPWKRDVDPSSTRIVKKPAKLGDYLYSTGDVWTGPSGGQWAELDTREGDSGWVLVQGPGFGLRRPALLDANALTVEVYLLGGGYESTEQGVVWEGLMGGESTIGHLKRELCSDTPLLKNHCVFGKELPAKDQNENSGRHGQQLPVDYMPEVADGVLLKDCKHVQTQQNKAKEGSRRKSDVTILLVYVGDLPEDLQFKSRKPLGKIPDVKEAHESRMMQQKKDHPGDLVANKPSMGLGGVLDKVKVLQPCDFDRLQSSLNVPPEVLRAMLDKMTGEGLIECQVDGRYITC